MSKNVKEIKAGNLATCVVNQTEILCTGKSINIEN